MPDFKKNALSFIKSLPKGKVASYGQVAAACGHPRAARQVGGILRGLSGKEKVPWWRVVNNQGTISIKGNWTATKELQKAFLEQEGIKISKDFTLDMHKYRFQGRKKPSQKGFSIIELIVVVAIIGLLASVVMLAVNSARKKARDAERKTDMAQLGRFLYASTCYQPNSGAGDYDLADLVPELKAKYPQLAQFSSLLPKDPKSGSGSQSNYRYQWAADGHCVLYANMENESEEISLPVLTQPTPGTGTGILKASAAGPNGTSIYYQIGR